MMKRVEMAVKHLRHALEAKDILEVACGCGEFSICANKIAAAVHCIDIDEKRLLPEARDRSNLVFSKMDAAAMAYGNESFDTVILYNAVGHLAPVLNETLEECLRVLRAGRSIYVISSFKMDKQVIFRRLLPLLERKSIPYTSTEDKIFFYLQIRKD